MEAYLYCSTQVAGEDRSLFASLTAHIAPGSGHMGVYAEPKFWVENFPAKRFWRARNIEIFQLHMSKPTGVSIVWSVWK